ncbi:hypothetical protein FM117_09995 [Micrococcus luteus Mu201]|nr:hypothetical protein FM117_09995 [Micrococcus luteus Mu201]
MHLLPGLGQALIQHVQGVSELAGLRVRGHPGAHLFTMRVPRGQRRGHPFGLAQLHPQPHQRLITLALRCRERRGRRPHLHLRPSLERARAHTRSRILGRAHRHLLPVDGDHGQQLPTVLDLVPRAQLRSTLEHRLHRGLPAGQVHALQLRGQGLAGCVQAVIGPVPTHRRHILRPSLRQVLGHEVRHIGLPATGEPDVEAGSVGVLVNQCVRLAHGGPLGPVRGERPPQMRVLGQVLVGHVQGAVPTVRVLDLRVRGADLPDGPHLPVQHPQQGVVAAGHDPSALTHGQTIHAHQEARTGLGAGAGVVLLDGRVDLLGVLVRRRADQRGRTLTSTVYPRLRQGLICLLLTGVDLHQTHLHQQVELLTRGLPGTHRQGQRRVDRVEEPVHGVQVHGRLRGVLGHLQHPATAHRAQLLVVTGEHGPRPRLVQHREQAGGHVLGEHPGLIHHHLHARAQPAPLGHTLVVALTRVKALPPGHPRGLVGLPPVPISPQQRMHGAGTGSGLGGGHLSGLRRRGHYHLLHTLDRPHMLGGLQQGGLARPCRPGDHHQLVRARDRRQRIPMPDPLRQRHRLTIWVRGGGLSEDALQQPLVHVLVRPQLVGSAGHGHLLGDRLQRLGQQQPLQGALGLDDLVRGEHLQMVRSRPRVHVRGDRRAPARHERLGGLPHQLPHRARVIRHTGPAELRRDCRRHIRHRPRRPRRLQLLHRGPDQGRLVHLRPGHHRTLTRP